MTQPYLDFKEKNGEKTEYSLMSLLPEHVEVLKCSLIHRMNDLKKIIMQYEEKMDTTKKMVQKTLSLCRLELEQIIFLLNRIQLKK